MRLDRVQNQPDRQGRHCDGRNRPSDIGRADAKAPFRTADQLIQRMVLRGNENYGVRAASAQKTSLIGVGTTPRAMKLECSMDADNVANDSAKSTDPERTSDMDSGEPESLRNAGSKLETEHSEFDDPGFRSAWVMPVGLGIFLVAVALIMIMT
jgi:hypothetical protein